MLRQLTSLSKRVMPQSRNFSAAASTSFHERVSTSFKDLMKTDWVDADDKLALEYENAEALVKEYRSIYTDKQDNLYSDVEQLHIAKEAAQATEAYARHAMFLMREHEDMVGPLGNNPRIPEGGANEAVQTMKEYVEFVNCIENKQIRRKVEDELGRKMTFLKMVLSVQGFSSKVAPIAGDKILT